MCHTKTSNGQQRDLSRITLFKMLHYLAQLAQSVDVQGTMLSYGPLGFFCLYFAYRDEKRAIQMRESESKNFEYQADIMHRLDGLTRALLVREMEDNPSAGIREYARTAIAKIDSRADRDAKRKP